MIGREASIAARLKNAALTREYTFQYASLLYMQEGFLRRLARSEYRDDFALKGGLLLQCMSRSGARSTKDMDFLGRGIDNDNDKLSAIFKKIIEIELDDGLRFDPDSITSMTIAEGVEYHGVRISMKCFLGTVRNGIQIDIGFGDAVDPPPRTLIYPGLLEGDSFAISVYPLAVVIAEKFEAMVSRAGFNSRMKDFWDISFILSNFDVPQTELRSAFKATFRQRGTVLPDLPLVLRQEYADSAQAATMWKSFLKRTHLADKTWAETLSTIRDNLSGIYNEMIMELRQRTSREPLDEMLSRVTSQNRHEPIETGSSSGKEEW